MIALVDEQYPAFGVPSFGNPQTWVALMQGLLIGVENLENLRAAANLVKIGICGKSLARVLHIAPVALVYWAKRWAGKSPDAR